MEEQNRNTLNEALDKLPTYRAPEGIWEQVESQLSPDKKSPYVWYWASAAAIALLLGLAITFFSSPPPEPAPIRTETEEAIDSTLHLEPLIERHVTDSIK